MGECGCAGIEYTGKIVDADGHAWLFGVYPSCNYCSSPAGVQIIRVAPEDWHLWDVEHVPDMTTYDDGTAFISVADPGVVRKQMVQAIAGYTPESGTLDEIDADVLADEAFRDLREVVWKSK